MKAVRQFKTLAAAAAVAALILAGCESYDEESGAKSTEYTLTINPNPTGGGTVSRDPEKTTYNAGDTVAVTAAANDGYNFVSWAGVPTSTTDTTVKVVITGDLIITANFALLPEYTLSIILNPSGGGTVSRDPKKTTYNAGDTVAVTAKAAEGYRFVSWAGIVTSADTTEIIVMTKDLEITANFERSYTITFNAGNGASPASANTNSDFKLTSLPTPTRNGYTFDGWYTAANGGSSVTTSTTFSGNATVFAQWKLGPTFTDSRDSKIYKQVKIGTQVWMGENLNYDVPDNTTDVCYGNDNSNCDKYGRLYDWNTALTVCPDYWHLPSDAEWTVLTNHVGSDAMKKLMSTSGWNDGGNGTDDYGEYAVYSPSIRYCVEKSMTYNT